MEIPISEGLTPCLTGGWSCERRRRWKERYRYVKKCGIRVGFAGVTTTGLVTVVTEACADGVKRHAKRYLGGILINTGLTFVSGGVPLVTNATRIVRYAKACHSVCAASWRAAHNIAELPMIVVDYALFGEYISSCGEVDYDLYSNTTDVVSSFTIK
jgi:hypothetical protein